MRSATAPLARGRRVEPGTCGGRPYRLGWMREGAPARSMLNVHMAATTGSRLVRADGSSFALTSPVP
jgi:hypothetical protein